MLKVKRFTLKCQASDTASKRQLVTEVEAFVVQYPEEERRHVFLHIPSNLLKVDLPKPNKLRNYAEVRLDIHLAERALKAAKQEILRFIKETEAPEGKTRVRIAADESADAPCVTLYPWKRGPSTKVIGSARRLSIITLPERFDEDPPLPSPSNWRAARIRTDEESEEWLIFSPELFNFLIEHYSLRKDAEARAQKAYAELSARSYGYERAIKSVVDWAMNARFIGRDSFISWRKALAQAAELNETETELLLLSGPAKRLFVRQTECWVLISTRGVSDKLIITSGSAGWSFRFPSSSRAAMRNSSAN